MDALELTASMTGNAADVRVLPGQRYVGVAVWRGRKVLAKLLVGNKAPRAFSRELEGARLLAAQGLPTPLLLADGLREGEGGWLLFEFWRRVNLSFL